ncbi:MAG TPA: Gfo/Idh/MocA family oxidoreductase [Acidimicrobiales bacterium]|nr:Gfo/Idh/MocA family oxidoreductase [Acidimicrobiales bacterium]
MRAAVVGVGAVGARVARQLLSTPGLEALCVADTNRARADAVARSLGSPARVTELTPEVLAQCDVVVLATPGSHRAHAEAALEHGVHVVSLTGDIAEVKNLLDLDAEARERDLTVVVGAGFSPGLSCVLARHAAQGLDAVDEVHVATFGTAGPSCARAHRRAMVADALDWVDGAWSRPGGGGARELVWFPDPVGGRDCCHAGLPDSLLVAPAFPGVRRVTARLACSRVERLTALVPRPRPRMVEGQVGAVRVEVRGRRGGATDVHVLGAIDRPALAAGAVAAVAATFVAEGRLGRSGAAGLAELVDDSVPFLQDLSARGVRAARFEGSGTPAV